MERLIGKKVWVIQYDDEDDTVLGWCEGFARGFIAIRGDKDDEPTLYVNLQNVREIEIYRPPGDGELRLLRFPAAERGPDEDDPSLV
jgi:hypothetical protein